MSDDAVVLPRYNDARDEIYRMGYEAEAVTAVCVWAGVAPGGLKEWFKSRPEMAAAYQQGLDDRDRDVNLETEKALARRAAGGTVEEWVKVPGGTAMTSKFIPPDREAAVFLLTKRDKERWGAEETVGGQIGVGVIGQLNVYLAGFGVPGLEPPPRREIVLDNRPDGQRRTDG